MVTLTRPDHRTSNSRHRRMRRIGEEMQRVGLPQHNALHEPSSGASKRQSDRSSGRDGGRESRMRLQDAPRLLAHVTRPPRRLHRHQLLPKRRHVREAGFDPKMPMPAWIRRPEMSENNPTLQFKRRIRMAQFTPSMRRSRRFPRVHNNKQPRSNIL